MATDQELFAGYCLGVAVQMKAHSLQTGDASFDAETARVDDRFVDYFREYLQARGLFSGVRSTVAVGGIITARKRGEIDDVICQSRIKICVQNCYTPGAKYDEKCMKTCDDEEPSCVSIQRCSNLSALPF